MSDYPDDAIYPIQANGKKKGKEDDDQDQEKVAQAGCKISSNNRRPWFGGTKVSSSGSSTIELHDDVMHRKSCDINTNANGEVNQIRRNEQQQQQRASLLDCGIVDENNNDCLNFQDANNNNYESFAPDQLSSNISFVAGKFNGSLNGNGLDAKNSFNLGRDQMGNIKSHIKIGQQNQQLDAGQLQLGSYSYRLNDGLEEDENAIGRLDGGKKINKSKNRYRRFKVRFWTTILCLNFRRNTSSVTDVTKFFEHIFQGPKMGLGRITASCMLVNKFRLAQQDWIVKNNHMGIKQFLSSIPITDETKFVDMLQVENVYLLNELIYYMNYSITTFGWIVYGIDGPHQICCLMPYLRLNCCCQGNKTKRKLLKLDLEIEKEKKKQIKMNKNRKQSQRSGNGLAAAAASGDRKLKFNNATVAPTSNSVVHSDNNQQPSNPTQIITSQPTNDINSTIISDNGEKCYDADDLPIIFDDNCIGCNVAAANRRLRGQNYDMIYVSYKSETYMVPFIVVADHSKKTVIVSLRGTMSVSDALIDCNCMIEPIPHDPPRPEMFGHRGMILTAINIKQLLTRHRVLDAAFACRPELGSDQYTLVFCGHSLGGGLASMLGLLYLKEFPTLKAYCFSPPCGVLSLAAVEETKKFAYGVTLGHDVVGRVGLVQIERLKYQGFWAMRQIRKSNVRILAGYLFGNCCSCGGRKTTASDDSTKTDSNTITKYDYEPGKSLDFCFGQQQDCPPFEYEDHVIEFPAKEEALFAPGNLIHIVKDYSMVKPKNKSTKRNPDDLDPFYRAIWTENTDYDRIVIDDGMFADHLPFALFHSMKMLFSRTMPVQTSQSTSRLNNQHQAYNSVHMDGSSNSGINTLDKQHQSEDKSLINEEDARRQIKMLNQDKAFNNNDKDSNNNNTTTINIDKYYLEDGRIEEDLNNNSSGINFENLNRNSNANINSDNH